MHETYAVRARVWAYSCSPVGGWAAEEVIRISSGKQFSDQCWVEIGEVPYPLASPFREMRDPA